MKTPRWVWHWNILCQISCAKRGSLVPRPFCKLKDHPLSAVSSFLVTQWADAMRKLRVLPQPLDAWFSRDRRPI
jgi:hypothetical protein